MLISSALPARHRKHELAQALRAGQLSPARTEHGSARSGGYGRKISLKVLASSCQLKNIQRNCIQS